MPPVQRHILHCNSPVSPAHGKQVSPEIRSTPVLLSLHFNYISTFSMTQFHDFTWKQHINTDSASMDCKQLQETVCRCLWVFTWRTIIQRLQETLKGINVSEQKRKQCFLLSGRVHNTFLFYQPKYQLPFAFPVLFYLTSVYQMGEEVGVRRDRQET